MSSPEMISSLMQRMSNPNPTFKSIPAGAATSVWAGVVAAADAIGGRYCENCGVAKPTDDTASSSGIRSYATDAARAEALWARSEELVRERFPLA